MDRLNGRNVAMGVALAFAFAGSAAVAHGTDRASSDARASGQADVRSSNDAVPSSGSGDVTSSSNAMPSSNPATSYDTGKNSPYSGAQGEKTTPPASDEDHNDQAAYPPAPPRADTSNVPPEGSGKDRPSSHPGSEENLDGMRNGQG